MVKAGIIDPTNVVRHALLNAASMAGLLITTEAMAGAQAGHARDATGRWDGDFRALQLHNCAQLPAFPCGGS